MEQAARETDPSATRSSFTALALQLFGLHFKHNDIYRRLCLKIGATPGAVKDWQQLPSIPTQLFKEMDVTCLPPPERTTVFYSSGTTGHSPSRHYHNDISLELYEASVKSWFRAYLIESPFAQGEDSDAPFAEKPVAGLILTPDRDQAPNSSLVWMFEAIRRWKNWPANSFLGEVGPDGEWTIKEAKVLYAIHSAVTAGSPLLLLGTSLLLARLVEYMAERNLQYCLPPGSRVMHTGGYKGRLRKIAPEKLEDGLRKLLGLPSHAMVTEYGMSELSSQAYKRTHVSGPEQMDEIFHFPPWARVQVISPETGKEINEGEKGLLRICDLANVYSAMIIQTEDMAVRRGTGFELLGRAEGSEVRGCSRMSL